MAYTRTPNAVIAGKALKQSPTPVPLNPAGALQTQIDAEIASTIQLGVVQVGAGLQITPDGVLSTTGGGHECRAISVSDSYTIQPGDYYVGVTASGPTTITLPLNPEDCRELIIKADMGPPLGSRKVTVLAQGTNLIDDSSSIVLTIPYESVSIISQGGNWHIT